MPENRYSQLVGEKLAHIILTLDTKEPIALGDFVKAFTSLSEQYERHVKAEAPEFTESAEIYVAQVRAGSIIAELIPVVASFVGEAQKVILIVDFVRKYADKFIGLSSSVPIAKGELQTFADAVEAIANDPNGSMKLEAAVFEDGKKEIRAAFKFDTSEARTARNAIERRIRAIEIKSNADHERVLMVFTRSDINHADIGKRSGERVRIEELSDKSLALMYGSQLAEERIKHEIREADDNVFKKGFVVDVNVRLRDGNPVAYSVTNLHDVIDLPD